jgi:hypothetical protein
VATTKNLIGYSGSSTITCTLPSLAAGSARESVIIDNRTNLYADYEVALTFTILSGSPGTVAPIVNIYANGSVDAVLWPIIQLSSGAARAMGQGDTSVGALANPANLQLIGSFMLQTTTSSAERTFRTQPFSVAQGFPGGVLPPAFSLVIEDQTGLAFSTSTVTTAALLEVNGVYTTSGT